ncbi:unnamed protein product [Heligmosomoides polygyrus]|uniref:Kinesin motor domain-containing protein n=1 Tax=Heligmosomoides polygyrus TaxID=6339 RepID=A0A183FP25_HELPZ|nr:unnamed protein product [Heligmosomoides polygyrus]
MRPAAGDRWKDDDDYDYDHDHDQGERMKTDWQQRRRGDEEEQLRGSRGARQKRGRAPSESPAGYSITIKQCPSAHADDDVVACQANSCSRLNIYIRAAPGNKTGFSFRRDEQQRKNVGDEEEDDENETRNCNRTSERPNDCC